MRAPRSALAASSARRFAALKSQLIRHRALCRLSLASLAFALVFAASPQGTTQAGPQAAAVSPVSILPQNIGVGLATDRAASIAFDAPMDRASVEAALRVVPDQPLALRWSADATRLSIVPGRRWRTDQRYQVTLGAEAVRADRTTLGAVRHWAFTTQTAPTVSDFQVLLAGPDLLAARQLELAAATDARLRLEAEVERDPALPPTVTAHDVSATTTITISFNAPMNRSDVLERFAITPAVAGALSWSDDDLTFSPAERLVPGSRYTVSVAGAHDQAGNPLGGKANFSFTVRPGAQLTVVQPGLGESDVQTTSVQMWFSLPMDTIATDRSLSIVDGGTGTPLAGDTNWNQDGTQLTFAPSLLFPDGHRIDVVLGDGSRDADGNPVSLSWSFTTRAPPLPPPPPPPPQPVTVRVAPPVVPPPAPSSSLEGYALNQVNAARAAYGSAPLVLDGSISAVAYAHAYDQAANGYFSHISLDGRTRDARLQAGGVSYSFSGENQCYLVGRSLTETLDWCHAQFMAEPYPGFWNHINNILNPRFSRMGVGIAQVGAKVVVTWDFTD